MPRQRPWPPSPWVAALVVATARAAPTSQPTHVFEGPTFEPTTVSSKPSAAPTAIMDTQYSFAYETMVPVAEEDAGSAGSSGGAYSFSYSYAESAPTSAVTGAPSATMDDRDGGKTQPEVTAAPSALPTYYSSDAPSAKPTVGTSKPSHARVTFRGYGRPSAPAPMSL